MVDVVFLDFDGVTHPLFPRADRAHRENQHFVYLPNVMRAIQSVSPGCVLVISSAWRNWPDFAEKVPLDLQLRMNGRTPNIPLLYEGVREDEALQWIDTNMNGCRDVRWLAIDDMPSGWRSLEKVLLCDDGFREAEIAELEAKAEELFNASITRPTGIIC